MSLRLVAARSLLLAVGLALSAEARPARAEPSVARQWNEEHLAAIRRDFARPTVHARTLYHVAVAMWDAWAMFDDDADQVLHHEKVLSDDPETARAEAISFAAYRVLRARFASSPGAAATLAALDGKMAALGYDPGNTGLAGSTPAACGNRVAVTVLAYGLGDGANEAGGYANQFYEPVNPPLLVEFPGNPDIVDPNRFQELALDYFEDQNGNPIPTGYPPALSPEWGIVKAFALEERDLTVYPGPPGFDWYVYHDPGPPPLLGGVGDALYKTGFAGVIRSASTLDPDDGVLIDVSPASIGDNSFGTNDGDGYDVNPVTGLPYAPQIVPRGDYTRVLAEFWADGPTSETPPGHWFTIANYVADHPLFEKRLGGVGPVLDDLEWDVKTYLALGGALHDTAVAVWGIKGWYDYVRPVSAIRYMAGRGQSSDPNGPSYDPEGLPLEPGLIEVVTAETTAPGERHAHLAGSEGKIAILSWRGPTADPTTQHAGVGWILAESWWPFQRATFVTPPFPGYTSGHSAFSRAAAEVMTRLTGSRFFPGGLGEFHAPAGTYLTIDDGPSVDVTLQWASYYDAADECSLSRIYGGIHPTQDDIPSRFIGRTTGTDAFLLAVRHFEGKAESVLFANGFESGLVTDWPGSVGARAGG